MLFCWLLCFLFFLYWLLLKNIHRFIYYSAGFVWSFLNVCILICKWPFEWFSNLFLLFFICWSRFCHFLIHRFCWLYDALSVGLKIDRFTINRFLANGFMINRSLVYGFRDCLSLDISLVFSFHTHIINLIAIGLIILLRFILDVKLIDFINFYIDAIVG